MNNINEFNTIFYPSMAEIKMIFSRPLQKKDLWSQYKQGINLLLQKSVLLHFSY